MIKVLFDHQCFCEEYGGVSRVFSEILKTKSDEVEYKLALKYSNNAYLGDFGFSATNLLKKINIPKKHHIISFLNIKNTLNILNNYNPDIFQLTHYNPYIFNTKINAITVSTIHDLNFWAIPQFYSSKTNILKNWQVECSNKSDKIITISETSKKDLIKYLNIDEKKIHVIYHGLDFSFTKSYEPRLVNNPYILFVGRRSKYKNFLNVLKAFAIVKKKFVDLKLICTGFDFDKKEKLILQDLNLLNEVNIIKASETELVNLYSNAELFIYPSYYEGFGLPLLESMGCNCPVVCSDIEVFHEIAGNAACYFNPNNIDEIAERFIFILKDSNYRNELINTGIERCKSFSWEKTRNEYINFYKNL